MKNLRRNMKAVSTVLATLLMIAVAVAASLVAYAWVMGYIGGAIQIQSVAYNNTDGDADGKLDLLVYVQNVGQGAVTVQDVYVEGLKQNNAIIAPKLLYETNTTRIEVPNYFTQDGSFPLTVRVATEDGTFMEAQVTLDVDVP
jgi:FlaG/FlaF family flagellin (archaellin)